MSERSVDPEESGNDEHRPIRVFLVDDHGVVRQGMRAYFEMVGDIDVVGEAASGQEAIDRIGALASLGRAPDVVMMDLLMPGVDGITAISTIKQLHATVQVVAVTSFVAQDKVRSALQAGAVGYILKDAEADEVAASVRAAYRGDVYLAPLAAKRLAESLRDATLEPDRESLTGRERQVLALVANGASNKTIGTALSISERTVRTHVSNILMKLDLDSRTQAALWAIRQGLVPAARLEAAAEVSSTSFVPE